MPPTLLVEQLLNGVQYGVMLFLMAAGLTLIFGIMNVINLAHATIYMAGAFVAATVLGATGSFTLAVIGGVLGAALLGIVLELGLLRGFYSRSHLDQVLVTYGIILVGNDLTRLIWGALPLNFSMPGPLSGSVPIMPGLNYSAYRLAVLGVGLAVAAGLYVLVSHTRTGMWVRAGASDRPIAAALGVDVQRIFTIVFAVGAALAGLAGILSAPIYAVQIGMGDPVLILALVVTVIGGIGSIRGAFLGALLVGIVDTFGRVLLPAGLGSMVIFMLMAAILAWRPQGLFPVRG